MKNRLVALLFGLSGFTVYGESLVVTEPGTLQELMMDLPASDVTRLELSGKLNYKDLAYINQGIGKMASVESLDLSEITVEPSDQCYATGYIASSFIGMGTYRAEFYYSDDFRVEESSSSTGLGGAHVVYKIYSNQFEGLFIDNKTVKHVVLPKNLTKVGWYMFDNSEVESVQLPAGIRTVGSFAFSSTESLVSVNLPEGLERIEEGAFRKSGIPEVKLPKSCRSIGKEAFRESSCHTINLENVDTLGESCFWFGKLKGYLRLDAIREMGSHCFSDCNLDSVEVGDRLVNLPDGAFSDNHSLAKVSLPKGLKTIGDYAFSDCGNSEMRLMVYPEALEYVGCNGLPYSWAHKHLSLEDGVYYIGAIAYELDSKAADLEVLRFRKGTTAISPNISVESIRGLQQRLKRVEFPESLKILGGYSSSGIFHGCTALESVQFPEGMEVIGSDCFKGCTNLKKADLPRSLRYLGASAFRGTALRTVRLGEALALVGGHAFADCAYLNEVGLYSHRMHTYYGYLNGRDVLLCHQKQWDKVTSYAEPIFDKCMAEKWVVGPQVQIVPDYFAMDATNMQRLVFEEDGTGLPLEIGERAFLNCKQAKVYGWPKRLFKVGYEAFWGVGLPEVLSTGNIVSIGVGAFTSARGLKELRMEQPLKYCGERAFSEIGTLEHLYFNANLVAGEDGKKADDLFCGDKIYHVEIGADVDTVPESFLSGAGGVEKFDFEQRDPSRRLVFGESSCGGLEIKQLIFPDVPVVLKDGAFWGMEGVKQIRLSNRTEEIGNSAFDFSTYSGYSARLDALDVPPSVRSLGNSAFDGIDTLYFHTEEPPMVGDRPYDYYQVVYVPAGSEAAYRKFIEDSTAYNAPRVLPYAVERLSLDKAEVQVGTEGTVALEARVEPAECRRMRLDWESSAPEVAAVDAAGNIRIVGNGEAVISARLAYVDGFVATCKVVVSDDATGVQEVEASAAGEQVIYDLKGVRQSKKFAELPDGIYIVNGKKVMKSRP